MYVKQKTQELIVSFLLSCYLIMQTRVHKIGLCINLGQNRERREADRTHTDQRNFVGSQANKSQSPSNVRKKKIRNLEKRNEISSNISRV